MDFGYTPDDAAKELGIKTNSEMTLGRSFSFDGSKQETTASIDIVSALRAMNQAAMGDPQRAEDFAQLIRRYAPTVLEELIAGARDRQSVPLPAFNELLHLQTSLFDNWKPFGFQKPKGKGKGARVHRLMLNIEAWTSSFTGKSLTKNNRQFAATAPVLGAHDIERYLAKIPAFAKPKGDWIAYKEKLIAYAREGMLVAPFYNVTRGNGGYMLEHFIVFPEPGQVTTHGDDMVGVLFAPEGRLPITDFVSHVAKKPDQPLTGNVVLSSRLSTASGNAWRSGNLVTSLD